MTLSNANAYDIFASASALCGLLRKRKWSHAYAAADKLDAALAREGLMFPHDPTPCTVSVMRLALPAR